MKKTLGAILLVVIAVSGLGLAVSYASAIPWMNNWKVFTKMMPSASNRPVQQSWVRLYGVVTKWGSTNVTGFLSVQVKTTVFNVSDTRKFTSATAIWTTNQSRPINAVKMRENFTYSFYSARLVNASVALLNYGDSNFFMNGTWNVFKVTTNFTIITNSVGDITSWHCDQSAVAVATKAYGELNVTSNWTRFTLAINGIDPLKGSLVRSMMRQMQFNPFKVNDDGTDSVTKADLASVAKSYGAMPGWGNYDQRMDFNFNYKIDIADLTTVAANVQ